MSITDDVKDLKAATAPDEIEEQREAYKEFINRMVEQGAQIKEPESYTIPSDQRFITAVRPYTER